MDDADAEPGDRHAGIVSARIRRELAAIARFWPDSCITTNAMGRVSGVGWASAFVGVALLPFAWTAANSIPVWLSGFAWVLLGAVGLRWARRIRDGIR